MAAAAPTRRTTSTLAARTTSTAPTTLATTTTSAVPTTLPQVATSDGSPKVADAGTTGADPAQARLRWIIWGLVALAAMILLATVIFWWTTRPGRRADVRVTVLEDEDAVGHDDDHEVGDWYGEESDDLDLGDDEGRRDTVDDPLGVAPPAVIAAAPEILQPMMAVTAPLPPVRRPPEVDDAIIAAALADIVDRPVREARPEDAYDPTPVTPATRPVPGSEPSVADPWSPPTAEEPGSVRDEDEDGPWVPKPAEPESQRWQGIRPLGPTPRADD